jgi:tRNA threonylcarbamoyladenosine biosynthesis protein TsaE
VAYNFICNNLEELPKVAAQLLEKFGDKKIVCFYGQMGAGKTTLIKAICNQLGVAENVSSPTFSLVNEYKDKNAISIFHFDFYRIEKESEVYDMGYEDYFFSGNLCLIEWAELIPNLIPATALKVFIEVENEKRHIRIEE